MKKRTPQTRLWESTPREPSPPPQVVLLRIRVGPELAAKLRAMMTIPDARPHRE